MSSSTLPSQILNQLDKKVALSNTEVQTIDKRGKSVKLFRRYQDGDHDQKLSENMRKLLRIEADDPNQALALNYMDVVIQTMADRCILQTVEAESGNKQASDWAQTILADNRYDALQADVHEAAIRDGDAFLMVSWDNEAQRVLFTFEEAWDGVSGIIPVYRSRNKQDMECAVKVWQIDSWKGQVNDVMTRVNVYFPNRVEKWGSVNNGTLAPFIDDPANPDGNVLKWTRRDGETPLGIPLIHFRNAGRGNFGASELRNAIGPQNALNRFFYSTIIAAELTAFAIYFAKGFDPDADITPGALVVADGLDATIADAVDFRKIDAASMQPILQTVEMATSKIGSITRTPAPEFGVGGNDSSSGEALKQREIGLLGKVRRFTNRAGNSWEDALALAWRVQEAFGREQPPAYKRWYSRWRSAEVRNDVAVVDNAVKMQPVFGDMQTMRNVADVFGLDEEKIQGIVAEKNANSANVIAAALTARANGRTDGAFGGAINGNGVNGNRNGNGGNSGVVRDVATQERVRA